MNLNSKYINMYDELNSIHELITNVRKILLEETNNFDNNLVYEGDLNLFTHLNYKQINNQIEYMKSKASSEEFVKLDNLKDVARMWFENQLLKNAFFSTKPISYNLASKLDELIFQVESFNECYFKIVDDDICIDNIEALNNLESIILNVLFDVKRKMNKYKKSIEKLKASSDYIRRIKK